MRRELCDHLGGRGMEWEVGGRFKKEKTYVYLLNGNPLQQSCLENPMEEPGVLQSIGLQRVRHD